MPTNLSTKAVEKGTFIITTAFADEDGTAVTPQTFTWTLTNKAGTVINSREDVAGPSPLTASIDTVLQGADLAILSPQDDRVRVFTIEGTYNSNAGSNLPLHDKCTFIIQDFEVIS